MRIDELRQKRDFAIKFTKYLQQDIASRAAYLKSIGKEPSTDTIFCMEKIIESEKIQEATLFKEALDGFHKAQERKRLEMMMKTNSNTFEGENI